CRPYGIDHFTLRAGRARGRGAFGLRSLLQPPLGVERYEPYDLSDVHHGRSRAAAHRQERVTTARGCKEALLAADRVPAVRLHAVPVVIAGHEEATGAAHLEH